MIFFASHLTSLTESNGSCEKLISCKLKRQFLQFYVGVGANPTQAPLLILSKETN